MKISKKHVQQNLIFKRKPLSCGIWLLLKISLITPFQVNRLREPSVNPLFTKNLTSQNQLGRDIQLMNLIIAYQARSVTLPSHLVFDIWQQEAYTLPTNFPPQPYHSNFWYFEGVDLPISSLCFFPHSKANSVGYISSTTHLYINSVQLIPHKLVSTEKVQFGEYLKSVSCI